MERRELAGTGLKTSILGFGASSLGQEFRAIDLNEALRAVHVAIDSGINFFDTSAFYGRGMSEIMLGLALCDVPRERYVLCSKLGRYDVDKFDFSARREIESVDISLHRLHVEYLDIMLCHDIEYANLRQIVDETLPALRRIQRQGKVRWVGVSGFPLGVFRDVLAATDVDVVMSYSHYTLQRRTLADIAPMLQDRNVGILNAAPFDMRILTNASPPDWHPAPEPIRIACRRAARHCAERGVDIAKLALQFSTRNPDFAVCVAGTASPERVCQWVAWLDEPLDEALLAEVEAILAPAMNQSYASGLPENNALRDGLEVIH